MERMGFEIIRIQYLKKEKNKLQIMIDKDSGLIEVSDCANASRQISVLLDVADPIPSEYELEVSSPGINRPLTRFKDFGEWQGYNIKLTTFEKIGDRKKFRGKLVGIKNTEVILELEGQTIGLEFEWIEKAHLFVTFEEMVSISRTKSTEQINLADFDNVKIKN